jgi:hypothetical protein
MYPTMLTKIMIAVAVATETTFYLDSLIRYRLTCKHLHFGRIAMAGVMVVAGSTQKVTVV